MRKQVGARGIRDSRAAGAAARRVGVDPANQEIVVFDEAYPGQQVFHGHARSWSELRPEMQAALRRAGLIDARGRIIAP
jgi:hypothetical protein